MTLEKVLDLQLGANSLKEILIACVLLAAVTFGGIFVRAQLRRKFGPRAATRAASGLEPSILEIIAIIFIEQTKTIIFVFLGIYIASLFLTLPPHIRALIPRVVSAAFILQGGLLLSGGLSLWLNRVGAQREQEGGDGSTRTTMSALALFGRMVLWVVILLLMLDNLGINITTLIAGLGVGGVAVALAVQTVLGDMLSSVSIVLDKPFVVGDAIALDNLSGTVEKIGLRTTRVRADTGEQLILSNSDMLKGRIRNYKRMQQRPVVFNLEIACDTTVEQLRRIPTLVRTVMEPLTNVRFDRAHLRKTGTWAFTFEVAYTVMTTDYLFSLDVHQEINLRLVQVFRADGIAFARPPLLAQPPAS